MFLIKHLWETIHFFLNKVVRTWDLSHEGHTTFMTCRHSSTAEYRYLNACDCMYWYCMLLLGRE